VQLALLERASGARSNEAAGHVCTSRALGRRPSDERAFARVAWWNVHDAMLEPTGRPGSGRRGVRSRARSFTFSRALRTPCRPRGRAGIRSRTPVQLARSL